MGSDLRQVLNTFVTDISMLPQIVVALTVLFLVFKLVRDNNATKIPGAAYPPLPLGASWVAAYRLMLDPLKVVTDGIKQFNGKAFRIATLQKEYIVVTQADQVAEYIRAPDNVLNMLEAADDQQQIQWTMGYGVTFRPYHAPVVRNQITGCLATSLPTMFEEMSSSFDELIGRPAEYRPFKLYDIIATTVARTSNRVFCGPELAGKKDFIENAVDYAQGVVISAEILRPFPDWTKKFLVKWCPIARYRQRAINFLGPTIRQRLASKAVGDVDEEPDDLIQWLLNAAPPEERNVEMLTERVMALNVASIHTTTMNFTYALYSLAAEPEKYLPELRAEARQFFAACSLTRESIAGLVKIDSFLRESSRMGNDGLLATQRNAKQQFTFKDGTVIPAGASVGTPLNYVHKTSEAYDRPDEFDGFRFSRPNEQGTQGRKTFVSTDVNFQAFGHGRHACPGRFFAAAEMKLMFAILLLRYDIMLENGKGPQPMRVGTMSLPDAQLYVLLRNLKDDD